MRLSIFCASMLALCPTERLTAQAIAVNSGDKVLVTCAEVRKLTAADADRGLKVRLEAVVTVVPGLPHSGLILQDATAGIWIDLARARQMSLWEEAANTVLRGLKVGDRVRLEGVTERGGFAPVVVPQRLAVLASDVALPDAPSVTVPAVLSGKHDVQRVTMKGVVQDTSVDGQSTSKVLILKLMNSGGPILLRVPRAALPPEAELLDTQISVTGTVISRHNSRAEMSGVVLVTDRVQDVQVLKPGLLPEKAPVLSLASLRPFEIGGLSNFRRRITGTVTLWQPGHRLILQEGSAAVEVTTSSTQPISLGSVVEAAGFVSRPSPICCLENAVLRVLRSGRQPAPVEITLPELLDASQSKNAKDWQRSVFDYHYRLVRLTGTLVDAFGDPGQKGRTLLLRSGDLLLPVRWDGAQATFGSEWRPGSEMAVTGIVLIESGTRELAPYYPSGNGDVFLLLRDADDVRILSAASWWTRQRLVNGALAALGLIILVLFVIVSLSRQVHRQAAELAGRIAFQKESEIRFDATLAERNRLGADMHDGLQQFLAGLSMQLEAAQGSLEMGRDATPALQAARKLLLTLREDFRNCLNALRDTQAEMHIQDILERTSAIIRACHPVEMRVDVQGVPVMLPGKAVANLMLIVQEAASNAVRHGKAQNIVLRCEFTPEAVAVAVADDGVGFDPEAIAADDGHYGLPNMRERIDRLHGTLTVTSQLGQGTHITARVPLPIRGIA